jgi:hypothetical protein
MQYLQQRPVTWQQFREALLARFDLVNASEVAQNKIKRLRQFASVQDYTRRFLALCAEIDNLSEAEKYDRYFDGLKAEVHNALVLQGITDFTALMASAERVDALQFQQKMRQGSTYRKKAEINGVESGSSGGKPGAKRPDITCYNCGGKGHISRNCKKPKQQRQGKPQQQRQEGSSKGKSDDEKEQESGNDSDQ